MGNSASQLPPLQLVPKCETSKFMGTWFVVGNIPTFPEKKASNAVEKYSFVSGKKHDIDIDFQYNNGDPITSKLSSLPQKGYIQGENKDTSSKWQVSPFGPIRLDYPIIELDEDNYNWCVIGYSSRSYAWIMGRKPRMDDDTYNMLVKRLVDVHKYDISGLRKVPQKWTAEERARRGLDEEIPDDMLFDEGKNKDESGVKE
mmetsp:Transcript_14542/g.21446  ORF Transcript_14542/g.21446 Transcript_14542/m.21446 type:complete len:201 (-) Transcript_14542:312-914(-)|eukprot:CAMPEP_0195526830 /NCGR_PEP_ID=MMETSP0794_2-20130614/28142_1 /TAXON_ID=515487 /ORGANISM="Stephanopyxis turris, Strain CCMP 815" /LENGTH=200 /DNA_ID=CAMNT_0040657615 /DNA_START=103 /DNA_END=705 /DNA_ORIENTATION=+